MNLPQNYQRIALISAILAILLAAVCFVYSSQIRQFFQEKQHKIESVSPHQKDQQVVKEKLENTLFKRVDFVNKLIQDFHLDEISSNQKVFYKDGEQYKELTLSDLLSYKLKEIGEIKNLITKNGVFVQNDKGAYIKKEIPKK